MDGQFKSMQRFEAETKLRELIVESITPFKDVLLKTCKSVARLDKMQLLHSKKLANLELVYFGQFSEVTPSYKPSPPDLAYFEDLVKKL